MGNFAANGDHSYTCKKSKETRVAPTHAGILVGI